MIRFLFLATLVLAPNIIEGNRTTDLVSKLSEAELAENARNEWSGMSVLLDKLYSDIVKDVGKIVDEIRRESALENDLYSAQQRPKRPYVPRYYGYDGSMMFKRPFIPRT